MDIEEHVPLAPQTTFGVGGAARYHGVAQSLEDIQNGLAFAEAQGARLVCMGGGSNMLADDGEADALFLTTDVRGIVRDGESLSIGAGEVWDDVVAYAVREEMYGIENLSGIPGSMGGAVVQNIGAYGAALSQHLSWVDVYDTRTNEEARLTNEACLFGYRDSVFKKDAGRYIILRAGLTLTREKKMNLSYKDVAAHMGGSESSLPLLREAILSIRAQKFPDLSKEGTAGSFFKNPIVSHEEGERLKHTYPDVPLFPLPEVGGSKVPLAWILDHVLHLRGFALGPVRCFENQPLVLVADRGATARDVRVLALYIKTRMHEEVGIVIEPEVCVMRGADIAHTLDF